MVVIASVWLDLFGPDGSPGELTSAQMAARAVVVCLAGLALLRLGGPRILSRYSAVDVVVAIVLGSVLSRSVNGQATMGTTLLASAVIVVLQRFLAAVTWWSRTAGRMLKGHPSRIATTEGVDARAAALHSISRHDIEEAIRLAGYDPAKKPVEEAWLERDGRISIIPRRDAAQIRNVPDGGSRLG